MLPGPLVKEMPARGYSWAFLLGKRGNFSLFPYPHQVSKTEEVVICVGTLSPHTSTVFMDIQHNPSGASGDAWLSGPWLPQGKRVKDPSWKAECRNAVQPLAGRA